MEPAPDSPETTSLLERLRAGERLAFGQLLEQHRPYLRRVVELRLEPRLRSRVDPSDVIQEAQLEAAVRIDAYLRQPPMPFRLWLRQLTQDRLQMARRVHLGAQRRAVWREVALPEHSSLLLAQQLLDSASTPSQRMARDELALQVRQAVARLPEADRDILLMRTFEGLSFEEVACLLGIEAAAARQRHGRAILRLHQLLSADGLSGVLP